MKLNTLIQHELEQLPNYQEISQLMPYHPFEQLTNKQSFDVTMAQLNDMEQFHTYIDGLPKHAGEQVVKQKALSYIYSILDNTTPPHTDKRMQLNKSTESLLLALSHQALCFYIHKMVWLIPGWLSYFQHHNVEQAIEIVRSMIQIDFNQSSPIFNTEFTPGTHAEYTVNQEPCSLPPRLQEKAPEQNSIHFVFCIDPRSNLLRRDLERYRQVRTHGFAGFMNILLSIESEHHHADQKHCPTIVEPDIHIEAQPESSKSKSDHVLYWLQSRLSQVVIALKAVELLGPLYSLKTMTRNFVSHLLPLKQSTSSYPNHVDTLIKTHGTEKLAHMVKGMLDALNIELKDCKELILVSHGSVNTNNHFKRVLECGACAGHSSEPNNQLMAQLLQDKRIQDALNTAGYAFRDDFKVNHIHHNTTGNVLDIPSNHTLSDSTLSMIRDTNHHRAKDPHLPSAFDANVRQKHWGCVTPEYGLLDVQALMLSSHIDWLDPLLAQQFFIHDYDANQDPTGEHLAALLDGPGVVAFNIHANYYFSKHFPKLLSSGSKTTHSYIDSIGIVNEYRGDLKIGLPTESLFTPDRTAVTAKKFKVFCNATNDVMHKALAMSQHFNKLVQHNWIEISYV